MQDCSNSIASALELLQACAKPSIHLCILPVPGHFTITMTWFVLLHTDNTRDTLIRLRIPPEWDYLTRTCSRICIQEFSLLWRHNDHDGVSNHQPHGCLRNRLFRRRSNKTSKLRVTGLCVGNSPGPVNSPHKGPVTRKMFPFDDVIMGMTNNS